MKAKRISRQAFRRDVNKSFIVEFLGIDEAPEEGYYELPDCGYYFYVKGLGIVYDPDKITHEEAAKLLREVFVAQKLADLSVLLKDLSEVLVPKEQMDMYKDQFDYAFRHLQEEED